MAIYIKICKTFENSELADKLNNTENDYDTLVNAKTVLVMKIGYTRDDDSTIFSRDQAYRTENPNIIHYKLIKGPTKVEETKLHALFKKDKLKEKGREWFKVTKENFSIIFGLNTPEDIYNITKTIKLPRRKTYEIDPLFLSYIYSKASETEHDIVKIQDRYREMYRELSCLKEEYHLSYICSQFSVQISDINNFIDQYKTRMSEIKGSIRQEVEDKVKEFNNLTNTVDKFKLLVELSETPGITEKDINNFLDLVPSKYRDYYTLLGPDRIRANSYQESLLRDEWINKTSEKVIPDGVKDEIYMYFHKGGKYGKARVKTMLKDIYSRYEFKQTAKASDLETYFILRSTRIKEDNNWVNGFEIIGVR